MISAAQFRSRAERVFRRGNPDADVSISWEHVSRPYGARVGGGRLRSGVFRAEAPGFRSKPMIVTFDERANSIEVR